MRNRIPAALAAALLMFTLFSCGKAETAGEVNLEDLAKTLLAHFRLQGIFLTQ